MLRLADRVASSRGWKRRALAALAGAFGAAILAPLNVGIALVVPMVVAVWLLDGGAAAGRGWRSAFADGWWLGFGYHLAGFWWLGAAFLVDAEFTWALPVGVIGVPAILALFVGAGFVVARALWCPGPSRIAALAMALFAAQWAQGHWFSGFPWNSFGMALGGDLVPAQMASLCGLDGLNLFAVALAAAPATLADARMRHVAPALAGASLCAIVGFGAVRLAGPRPGDVPNVTIRLVQPGLRPDEKFSYENRDSIVDDYLALSRRDDPARRTSLADVTMLVWPESPFPFILAREPDEASKIAALLPQTTTLVTGAAREDDVAGTPNSPAYSDYYNSILVIAHGGHVLQSYDKVHLVPFGEYLPFKAVLRRLGLRNFVPVPGGFEPGRERHALGVPGMPPASPLICYEAIFPLEAMPEASGPRPAYLLNITNDGWFGVTTGPWQHLAQARLRSIEQGLPMVRDAATGISAFIDPFGRILQALPLGDSGILDGSLGKPIRPPLFARAPLWTIGGSALIMLCFMLAARGRHYAKS